MPRIFDKHHLAEQQSVRNVPLIGDAVGWGTVDINNEYNLVYMPKDPVLADALGVSPHSGGPISDYLRGTFRHFELIEQTKTGQAALQGDPIARAQIAAQYEQFIDASRLGLSQGKLFTNAPLGMTADDIRPITQSFYRTTNQFIKDNPGELAQVRTLHGPELAWSNVVNSEDRVLKALHYMQQSPLPLAAGGDDLAREGFAQALKSANSNNRLLLTEAGIGQIRNVLGSDTAEPLRVPYGQRGAASLDLLIGQVPKQTLVRSAGMIGTGADLAYSFNRAGDLLDQDNPRAARSEVEHALARNVGGWTGGVAGYGVATAARINPLGLAASTAVSAGVIYDKAVEFKDNQGIRQQVDQAGVSWEFNGRNWTREGLIDKTADGDDNPVKGTIHADYNKARELSQLANSEAAALALGKAPPLIDPFDIPAKSSDGVGFDNPNWTRNPQTEQWERSIKVGTAKDYIVELQTASPQRATELNQEAVARTLQNIADGRESIAAVYKEYALSNRQSELSPAVVAALPQSNVVVGSDKQTYERTLDGVWSSQGQIARGNLAAELELTWTVRQPILEQHQQRVAQLEALPPLTPEQKQQEQLLHSYRVAGVELKPGEPEAIALATQRTRAEYGLTGSGAMQLQLPLDASGQIVAGSKVTANSAIGHYKLGENGVLSLVATTSTEQIRQARQDLQTQGLGSTPTALDADNAIRMTPSGMSAPRMGSKSNDRDEQQDDPAPRQTQAQAFPTDHKDYALFLAIQQQLPKDTPDEKTAEVMHRAKLGGVERADQLDHVTIHKDEVFVYGKTYGTYGQVRLDTSAPSLQETLQRTQDWDQEQTLMWTRFREEQAEIAKNPTGPTMSMSMSGPATPPAFSGPADGGGGGDG